MFGLRPALAVSAVVASIVGAGASAQNATLVPFTVTDDAIPQPLATTPGDATRGRALVLDRAKGNCVTCHELPLSADFQGNLGPPLAGVADRYSIGELRLRVVDGKRINPESNMPSYYRIDGLTAVRSDWAGRPILSAQEIEDVLAYLMTLR